MTRPSLARRLFVTSLVGLVLLLVAGGGALSFAFRRSTESTFDHRLETLYDALVASLQIDEAGRPISESNLGDPRFDHAYSGWYWQISAPDGEILGTSRSLWDATLEIPDAAKDRATEPDAPAFELDGPRGGSLRALLRSATLPRGSVPFQIVLAGDAAELRREVDRFDALLLAALGALGAGILLLVAIQMRLALRPLHRLAAEIADVRAGTRDVVGPDSPQELAPLVDSLNELLAHDAQLVRRARSQAADLAHALKTPLSLVLVEAGELGDERGARIARHAETMRRHVDFRLATGVPRPALARERTPIRPVLLALRETLARLYPDLAVECFVEEGLVFSGAREDLEEIVGNLLENGCKWARHRVLATARLDVGRLVLDFEDDGPGLDAQARTAVLDRGVRLDEKAPGSGLGLAIVSDLVERYDGELILDRSPLGGLRVSTRFAAAKPA
jgi:signal transduction histidine kinase